MHCIAMQAAADLIRQYYIRLYIDYEGMQSTGCINNGYLECGHHYTVYTFKYSTCTCICGASHQPNENESTFSPGGNFCYKKSFHHLT